MAIRCAGPQVNSSGTDIKIVCTREGHEELKDDPARVASETTAVAPMHIEGELLGYLRNCYFCDSTILLTPEQQAVLSAHETHLAGPGNDGAESGD